jgi:hypothetical protein
MKIAIITVRVLLGLMFVVFGLNAIHPFLKMGDMPQGLAGDFMKALFMSNYFKAIGVFQVIGGLLLLLGFVPLGLLFLGPILVNILLFHIFLQPKGIEMGIVASILSLFLLWAYRRSFAGIVKTPPRTAPQPAQ